MHATHAHTHLSGEHRPGRVSRLLGVATVAGQFAVAGFQVATGRIEGAWAALQHGLHDAGDGIGYIPQVLAVSSAERSGRKKHAVRKATYWFMTASSAVVMAKIGSDVLGGQEPDTASGASIYAVGGSLALNTAVAGTWLWHLRKRGLEKTVDAHDLLKHARTDVGTALLAMAGVVAQRYYPLADEAAAMLGAAYTARQFWPSAANLAKAHDRAPGEVHAEGGIHAHEYVGRHRRDDAPDTELPARVRPRRWRTVLAAGAAAVSLLLGGAVAGGEDADAPAPAPASVSAVPVTAPMQPQVPATPPAALPAVTECVPVYEGDSMWRMSEKRIAQATGRPATAAFTLKVTNISAAASKNTAPNPHRIFPGSCITMPSITELVRLQPA